MSRVSGNEYLLRDGSTRVLVGPGLPAGAVLWNGFDYSLQKWVEDGVVIEDLKTWRTKAELERVKL